MCPGILSCLSLDLLGIRLLEQRCQLGAKLGQMIKQLRGCEVVRTGDTWVLINRCDPRLENIFPMGRDKIPQPCDRGDRRFPLTVMGNGPVPPDPISEVNTWVALLGRDIA